jgi:hypothetical protein
MRSIEARSIDQLDEDAAGGPGMEEGHVALDPTPRLAVDQLDSSLCEGGEGTAQIVDHEANVVQRRLAPLGEEAGHARLGIDRLDELDARVRRGQEGRADPLAYELPDRTGTHAQRVSVERK